MATSHTINHKLIWHNITPYNDRITETQELLPEIIFIDEKVKVSLRVSTNKYVQYPKDSDER